MTRLNDALQSRFDDKDEIRDIVNYGCSGGIPDFIYSTELSRFFDEYQVDIEDVLDEYDIQVSDLVKDTNSWTFQELKESAVWFVVESYCQNVHDDLSINN